ncbi:hypothetical protein GCM10010329_24890 [Streptomyces spiroverticillatus]|uniref:PPM-type phosphatase domain-containing protein n=1 Tax=Streptomyces finlayi TaxID=67296 RepID=A0A919C8S6_9ACTN|nr:protein phosphatase 2C domain-containing protein [Streptomyces finlayi]GHA02089.1 hypothetical protein GCM10010329_24890 [Streptomyces spiroverticillatus]GHC86334.1 hypothetical protein GCM10010334_17310 [Streptomyces finlayi]
MSQQGERRTGAEDDWWDRLYDEAAPDTGPTPSGHTVDDHFDSTPGAGPARDAGVREPPRPVPKEPRTRAPWEPPEPPEPPSVPPSANSPADSPGDVFPRDASPDVPPDVPPVVRPDASPDASPDALPDPRSARPAERGWDAWLPTPRRSRRVGGTEEGPRDAVPRPSPTQPEPQPEPAPDTGPEVSGPAPAPLPADWRPGTPDTGPRTPAPGPTADSGPTADPTRGQAAAPGPTSEQAPAAGPPPAPGPSAPSSPPGAAPDSPRRDADGPWSGSETSTWGPPPPLPGPPGSPGPRHDLRRTRRLWDEPSPDAYGPRPEPPAPDAARDDTPAADPRRAASRTEGRLRDVPPLPTSYPPRQDAPQQPPTVPPQPRRAPADPGVFGPPPTPADDKPDTVTDTDTSTTPHPETHPNTLRTETRPDVPTPTPAPTAPWDASVSAGPHRARTVVTHLGDGPPTYDAEPTALAAADPQDLGALVADTVLDGARYGSYTLRAASVRGDSARFRGEPRRDALLTARFGSGDGGLVLVAVASGARAAEGAHLAAAEACQWIAGAVGRSHARLAEDIRAGRRGDLKSGLHRLTDRSYGKLRARAAELGLEPGEYTADLRCLLLSADPLCRTRIYFGVGEGGLFRLRDGVWQDIEPPEPVPEAVTGEAVVGFGSAPSADSEPEEGPDGDRLTMDLGITTPPSPYVETAPPSSRFRFRASVARTEDVLLLCSAGLAEPLRGEAALAKELAGRWGDPRPPGLAAYLADVQLRVKGYADDRTAVAVWEA